MQFVLICNTIKDKVIIIERNVYMKIKKIVSAALAAAMITSGALALSACSGNKTDSSSKTSSSSASAKPTEAAKKSSPAVEDLKKMGVDTSKCDLDPQITYAENEQYGFQLDKPEKGENIAVIHTTEGDITLRLFPQYAPRTVENFIKLAKANKYNGVIFHRVINNFMIQTGDYENQDGTGGTSAFGSAFEDEFCDKLNNIRGSVAMANSGKDTNGSQFFINQNNKENFQKNGGFKQMQDNWKNIKAQLQKYGKDANTVPQILQYFGPSCYDADVVPDQIQTLYNENGGNPSLDGAYNAGDAGHTVFAQVIDGMEVVDKIAAAKTGTNDKPVKDIKIKSVEIKEYK